MPVEKFKNLEEARKALWTETKDPRLPSRIRQLWDFSSRLHPRSAPKGVQRFRSIVEANREREARSRKGSD